jgi:trehalose/maltose hydrolase-like predicted phosphorylase
VSPLNGYNCPSLTATFRAQPGQTVHLEKLVTIFSSREADEPARAARNRLADLAGYATLFAAHERAWEEIWEASDVLIKGDPIAQLAVRHSLFQILIAPPRVDDRVSISAKTLSGFGYRGHVFWDTEIFVLLSHASRRTAEGQEGRLRRRDVCLGERRHGRRGHATLGARPTG